MEVKDINKVMNNMSYKTYLIEDKDMIRTNFTSEINFKEAKVIDDIAKLDTNTFGILEEIENAISKLDDVSYDALGFSFCSGLVVNSDKYKTSNVDDLFQYQLRIYPLKNVNGEYKRMASFDHGIYHNVSGKIKKIIHFHDLLNILAVLQILPPYVDIYYFNVLTEGFLGSCKPILFYYVRDKQRVLKKN